MTPRKYWYYEYEGTEFGRFLKHCKNESKYYEVGPFNTLAHAKKDALARFKLDLEMAKHSLRELRADFKRKNR